MASDWSALRVLVRGTGDVGSAVAHRLFGAGSAVVLHESAAPATTRRGMAFADAVFDGRAELDGVRAVLVDDARELPRCLDDHAVIPVVVLDLARLLEVVRPHVLVDARMRKRARPESQRGLAPFTVGLGPGFVAGETIDVAIETSWEAPGRVITVGAPLPLAGEPRALGGFQRERYVYAPRAGVFQTGLRVGDRVRAGEVVATIGATALAAPLDGILRGLTRDGVTVADGTKVIEIDPRGDDAVVHGIGERPRRIAEGVISAIREWEVRRRR